MAKRANPYIEDFIPQSKIHVGPKQFNNHDDRLKKVYEKTLNLLFKGAKKATARDADADALNEDDNVSTKKDKMKQLFIGKDGSLLHSGIMVSKSNKAKQCVCGGAAECECAYCDAGLCSACPHACARCSATFCVQCILTGSEASEVCVSCYS